MEDEFRNSPNSLCRLCGASQPKCLNPPSPVTPRVSLPKKNLAANKPNRASFLGLCSSTERAGTAPGQVWGRSPCGCPRTGGQSRGHRGDALSRAAPPRAARAAEPRPCISPGCLSVCLSVRPQRCADTAAPAPSRGHRVPAKEEEEGGGKGRRRRRRSHYQSFVPALAERAAENSLDVAKVPVAEVRGADDNVVALHGAGAASSGRAAPGVRPLSAAGGGGGG